MCGIAGIFNSSLTYEANRALLFEMTDALDHRGPDETHIYCKGSAGLGQVALSNCEEKDKRRLREIRQNENVITVLDGEIFNRKEIVAQLEAKDHNFHVRNDAELLSYLYKRRGLDFINCCNGQFAIALFDENEKKIILVRDRVGIQPLYYTTLNDGTVLFGSEIKSLFCSPQVKRQIDLIGLEQILTLWATVPPRTAFRSINELAPGCMVVIDSSGIKTRRYWKHVFPDNCDYEQKPFTYYSERTRELLINAVRLRQTTEVSVGAYLSGGLDSSIIAAIASRSSEVPLKTFSVTFGESAFDESKFQRAVSNTLGTRHHSVNVQTHDISVLLPQVLRHAESPLVRTAAAPLFVLSKLAAGSGTKIVLTGEGSDEIFGGYDIFKESAIRRFWARFPDSKIRPQLLRRTYPFIQGAATSGTFWQLFFKQGLTELNDPFYSHRLRWNNTGRVKKFCSDELIQNFDEENHVYGELNEYLDPEMKRWDPLCQAQYLEIVLFMSGVLLTTQGDRMLASNSISGRFPFLDHRVIEFAHTIPPRFKLNLLNEKYILKAAFNDILPKSICSRVKQPYRAPISRCFTKNNNTLSSYMLSAENLSRSPFFNAEAVNNLMKKAQRGVHIGEVEQIAIAAVASTELLEHIFVKNKS
ncbi:MAG: asparagine synthase (glutamine-hydrolyzing) [Chitinispirillales bacterium]|jgi:asparagine synthase (glutamine-hydrolysing)|nr:asparagine synthase (glutamine-hydrolyzing) [Chitinispirillales bacterium]